jgi:alkanesulfonate monooxygenase SsuD/methylene tetrahydromethanopterin reductase-like flavin-dependent oxidoreductase (luciferase family)
VARLADGWSPNIPTNATGKSIVAQVHHYAREAGRDPAALPLEGRVRLAGRSPADWVNLVQGWLDLGATHIIVETRGGGLAFPHQHLAALQQFREVIGRALG